MGLAIYRGLAIVGLVTLAIVGPSWLIPCAFILLALVALRIW